MSKERFIELKVAGPLSPAPVTLYSGDGVRYFSEGQRGQFAKKIVGGLQKNPHLMRQFAPEELEESMAEGRTVVAVGQSEDGPHLLAFAQEWQLPGEPETLECGTWYSFANGTVKGVGAETMRAAATLAMNTPGAEQAVALVAEHNGRAQKTMRGLLGLKDDFTPPTRKSDYVQDPYDVPIMMSVFDVTSLAR
jgi:RimJ/RimL family protein N-acetyltransferase